MQLFVLRTFGGIERVCDMRIPRVTPWAWPCMRHGGAVIAAERCHKEMHWRECYDCLYKNRGKQYIRPLWDPGDLGPQFYAPIDPADFLDTPPPKAPVKKVPRVRSLCALASLRGGLYVRQLRVCPAGKDDVRNECPFLDRNSKDVKGRRTYRCRHPSVKNQP